jgi:hypothetical protein
VKYSVSLFSVGNKDAEMKPTTMAKIAQITLNQINLYASLRL